MPDVLSVTRTSESRLSEAVRENSEFGATFSDHMMVADCEGGTWGEPQIIPYGPLLLSPSVSALHYGQSVFEGFKAHRTIDGRVVLFRPRDNHARLNRSAARLAMPEVPASVFMDGVVELLRLDREWVPHREGGALYVRPLYFATEEALFVRAAKRYRLVIITCPVGPYFGEPIRVLAEERYVRAFPGGTGDVKPAGNYAAALLAGRLAQEHGFHNVLWLDAIEHRFVEECGVMNVFFVVGSVVITPPLTGTILPGLTRDSVLTLLDDLGIEAKERLITIDEVFQAHADSELKEAFGVGTAATVAPIERIGYREREIQLPVGQPGSIGGKVRALLQAIQTGRKADKHDWLMPL
jgi:branched-chain amino acid aminotransferase